MIEKILRFKELRKIIPLGRTTLWLKIRNGSFPKPVPLGLKSVGWMESEIEEWIENQKAKR